MNNNWNVSDAQFLASLFEPAQKLAERFARNGGARIGQSTVVSQKMHTFEPESPGNVYVLKNVDAGQVFYGRESQREIYHMDVFHQCGLIDHRKVAKAVKGAVEKYNIYYRLDTMIYTGEETKGVNADWIDIQTGMGGGRITGSMNFGKKLSLCRAHENHVHIAAMLSAENIYCLFYIVMAVEKLIISLGFELRRNEKIIEKSEGLTEDYNSENYSDTNDSFMQNNCKSQLPSNVKSYQLLQDVQQLTDVFDNTHDLKNLLNNISNKQNKNNINHLRSEELYQSIKALEGLGILETEGSEINLTKYGREMKTFLETRMPEIEGFLRQTLRMYKPQTIANGKDKKNKDNKRSEAQYQHLDRKQFIKSTGELAIGETINIAAKRIAQQPNGKFNIIGSDIRQNIKRTTCRAEICLIMDASGSMTGQRIHAAKFLIRHLLVATSDKICVIIFQNNEAVVKVPLTRDYRQIEESLATIKAGGPTPMAKGMKTCIDYLEKEIVRKPLIILITDGVPTITDNNRDPAVDALQVAEKFKNKRYHFICIGLKPYYNYLVKLTETAGGKMYAFDELDKQVLVDTVWSEWEKRCM